MHDDNYYHWYNFTYYKTCHANIKKKERKEVVIQTFIQPRISHYRKEERLRKKNTGFEMLF